MKFLPVFLLLIIYLFPTAGVETRFRIGLSECYFYETVSFSEGKISWPEYNKVINLLIDNTFFHTNSIYIEIINELTDYRVTEKNNNNNLSFSHNYTFDKLVNDIQHKYGLKLLTTTNYFSFYTLQAPKKHKLRNNFENDDYEESNLLMFYQCTDWESSLFWPQSPQNYGTFFNLKNATEFKNKYQVFKNFEITKVTKNYFNSEHYTTFE